MRTTSTNWKEKSYGERGLYRSCLSLTLPEVKAGRFLADARTANWGMALLDAANEMCVARFSNFIDSKLEALRYNTLIGYSHIFFAQCDLNGIAPSCQRAYHIHTTSMIHTVSSKQWKGFKVTKYHLKHKFQSIIWLQEWLIFWVQFTFREGRQYQSASGNLLSTPGTSLEEMLSLNLPSSQVLAWLVPVSENKKRMRMQGVDLAHHDHAVPLVVLRWQPWHQQLLHQRHKVLLRFECRWSLRLSNRASWSESRADRV